ncbi:MAG: carboxypeptidase-like regulatory domain-containing protein [Ferruginibacter sp.]
MRVIFLFLLLFFITDSLTAQPGKISGKILNAASGQPLEGASLLLVNKNITRVADQNGAFSFIKLEPGTYTIKCTYAGFQDKIIDEIIVKENENTDLSISLDSRLSSEVVVTSKRIKAVGETVASLLIAQKNSTNVSDGITAESIKKTPDRSSSDVIKRVSGASIQDDRFAIIRGLNDRYNAAFINGAPLPSTESDRKAFAFDIFPSAILDNLVIYKTATPDKTGEFGGGIIEITTKSTSSQPIGLISIGQGYNSLITGKDRYVSEMKGGRDWWAWMTGRERCRRVCLINRAFLIYPTDLMMNSGWRKGFQNINGALPLAIQDPILIFNWRKVLTYFENSRNLLLRCFLLPITGVLYLQQAKEIVSTGPELIQAIPQCQGITRYSEEK